MGMEKAMQQVLGKMTYGIYILTTFHKKEINGMVASWVSQVSYDPAMVMVAIHPNRYSHHMVSQSGYFALHILANNQSHMLERFKGPDPEAKFASIPWRRGKTGCPILTDFLGYLECKVMANHIPGNHTLFIGEIQDAQVFSEGRPLSTIDYAGVYIGRD
jgi:flavin reductase (DIM6/NTAB) family NADH-FMN oxidoreductase RutF